MWTIEEEDKLIYIRGLEISMGFERFEYSDNIEAKEYQATKRLRCLRNLKQIQESNQQKKEYYNVEKEEYKKEKMTLYEMFKQRFEKKNDRSISISDIQIDNNRHSRIINYF